MFSSSVANMEMRMNAILQLIVFHKHVRTIRGRVLETWRC